MAAHMVKASDGYVLSYHDSLLRKEDVTLLDGAGWLNDKIIGFVFEYFEYDQFKQFSDTAVFICPEVTQFIKFSQGAELNIFLEPLNLSSKSFVFLVVNDNLSDTAAGGSHWSLLVFQRHLHRFSHFDSAGCSNARIAKSVAKKLQPFLNASCDIEFLDEDAPQQQNCYDCGVFAICIAEHLCKQFFLNSDIPLKTVVTREAVTRQRGVLKELILRLSEEQKQACSKS